MDIVFRNVLSGEEDRRLRLLLVQQLEGVAQGLQHGFGAEIRAADADADDHIGPGAQLRRLGLDGPEVGLRNRRGQMHPPQEVVALAFARMEQGVGLLRFGLHVGRNPDARFGNVQCYGFHILSD